MKKSRNVSRLHRKRRVNVRGTKEIPRLAVFRSLRVLYAFLIDDDTGNTLVAVDSGEIAKGKNNQETALKLGELLAEKAKAKKIKKVVFDRSGYKYHGKVKSLADGARQGGLKF